MKKGTVLRLHGFGLFDFVSKNGLLIAIFFGVSIGIAFGVFSGDKVKLISWYTENQLQRYLQLQNSPSFFRVVLDSYMSELFSMLLLFASGTSMLGALFVPAIALTKGALFGAFPALLYAQHSVKGIAFHAVLVLPVVFFFLIVYVSAVRESFRFSVMMAKLSLSGAGACDVSGHFKNYCGRYLVLSVAAAVPAILDAILSISFAGRFGLA